jgi:pimeloyl-ACP methyl ester carboxylesterase
LDAAQNDEPAALQMINIWSHNTRGGGFSHKPSHPGPGFSLPWSNLRLMQRQKPGVLLADFAACNAYQNLAAVAAVKVPTLVILGERDVMTPLRAGAALAAQLAHHELVTIPGAGHALMSEAPDQVLTALRGFLAAATA